MKLIHKIKKWIYKKRIVQVNGIAGYEWTIRNRAYNILEENYPKLDPCEHLHIMKNKYSEIEDAQMTIRDIVVFANEYGCTVDYLLGRTNMPYYTL